MFLLCTSTPPNSLLFSLFLLKVDAAAETQPRKEDALIDSTLSPVPEVVRRCCVSKVTQTQAPPTSPPPSTREKVRGTWKDTVWWYIGEEVYRHKPSDYFEGEDFSELHVDTYFSLFSSPTNTNCWTKRIFFFLTDHFWMECQIRVLKPCQFPVWLPFLLQWEWYLSIYAELHLFSDGTLKVNGCVTLFKTNIPSDLNNKTCCFSFYFNRT